MSSHNVKTLLFQDLIRNMKYDNDYPCTLHQFESIHYEVYHKSASKYHISSKIIEIEN